jgi:hypothetical protein
MQTLFFRFLPPKLKKTYLNTHKQYQKPWGPDYEHNAKDLKREDKCNIQTFNIGINFFQFPAGAH